MESSGTEFRISEEKALALREKFPDKFPVVISQVGSGLEIRKRKYLAASSTTFGELLFAIRRQASLGKEEAMFLYVRNGLVPTNSLVSEIWNQSKDEGCLYIAVYKESVFG